MRGPWAERLGTPTPIGLVSVERQDDHNEIINLTEESPDWGGDEDQDMEDAPEEAVVDTSASSGACGPAPIEREVGGAHSTAPLLQSNNKDARVIDDGWLHYDAYDLPIASGKMDRRVADALPCKHTREMRRIADFNVPDNRPKSDLKINANDRHHADMSFKLVRLLRHDAWRHVLPMDSGGWVPLDALARFYGVDHEYLVCLAAACHMDANCRMEVAMAPRHPNDLSLQAGLGDGTREDFHKGYGLLSWGNWRYLGIRCVQGHTLRGLHPERFGVKFTPAMAARAPCVRHATYLAAVPSILQSGLLPGGGNTRKRNQVHFAIVSLGDKTAKQGRQDAEVSIFVKKTEMAEALPLVLTSSLAVVVSREVDWKFFDKVVTHTEPPRVLWDSAYVSREYLGVCNDEGVIVAPPNASRKPSYTFEVASWDRTTKQEGEGRRRARSAGLILRDKHGCIAVPRKRSESVDRAAEQTAEREADNQEKRKEIYPMCNLPQGDGRGYPRVLLLPLTADLCP